MQEIKIKITKYSDQAEVIYFGNALYTDGLIIYEGDSIIHYSDEEVLIKKQSAIPSHMTFIKNTPTKHLLYTEFGVITLNVYTKEIVINENTITLLYQLENEESKLLIERFK